MSWKHVAVGSVGGAAIALAVTVAAMTPHSAEPPAPAKVTTPAGNTRLEKLNATRLELSNRNGSLHQDGSTYVDVLSAPIAPGKTATERVVLPDGAVLVPDSVEFIGVAAGKLQLIRLEMRGKVAFVAATNISNEVVPMAIVFRYR